MLVVSDSSPLIGLCRVGLLSVLKETFGQVVVPEAVWREITSDDTSKAGVQELLDASWLECRVVTDIQLVHLLRKDLGAGESEAIVLAREIAADFVLMDERLGRSTAQRLGLRCVGLIGLLIEAKRRGFISDAVAVAEQLREKAGFWVSAELLALLRNC
jgi:predicted nucleic acid-binding protein